jgi:hypothetical protein
VRLQATGAAAQATGDLNQVMPVCEQACLAMMPNQTLTAGNDARQRRAPVARQRLNLAQRVVVVITVGLALGIVASYLTGLGVRIGWKERAAPLGGLSNQRPSGQHSSKRKPVTAWRTGKKGSAR